MLVDERQAGVVVELKVSLFGPVAADLGASSVDLGGGKSRALLGYLAQNPAAKYSRGHLAALLWPDAVQSKSRQSLRSALYQLRRGIDAVAPGNDESTAKPSDLILQIDHDLVSLRDGAPIRSDVVDFQEAISRNESCEHEDLAACPACVESLETAVDLYQGEFLADVSVRSAVEYDEWLLLCREAFQNQALRALDRLVQMHHETGDHVAAHDRAFRILALNRYDEFAHRVIMASLAAQGHVVRALEHYQICVDLVRDELGVDVGFETEALGEELRVMANQNQHPAGSARRLQPPSPVVASEFDGDDALAGHGAMAPHSMVPFHRNPAFVGRDADLVQLAETLLPENTPPTSVGAVVLSGIGGVGKTQLAIEYAYRYGRHYPGGVFMVDFSDPGQVQAEIAAIGSELSPSLFSQSDGLSKAQQIARVRRYWQTGDAQLLIFDNCEYEDLAVEWLPVRGRTSVLITSRKGDWPLELPLTPVALEPLTRDASISYLVQATTHVTEHDAGLLASELGDHPLALQLAGQFLSRLRSLSVRDYVQQLRDSSLAAHLSLRGMTSGYSPTAHDQCVRRTFAVGYDQLTPEHPLSRTAKALLARIVCLAPGVPINRMLLIETLADPTDAPALVRADNGVRRLIELGFVTTDVTGALVMHRLIYDYITEVLQDDQVLPLSQFAIEEFISSAVKWDRLAAPNERFVSPVLRAHLHHVTDRALERESQCAPALALALGRNLRLDWDTPASVNQLNQGLTVAKKTDNKREEGRLLLELVVTLTCHGDITSIVELAQRACDMFAAIELEDPLWLAVAKDRLAASQWLAGEGQAAYQSAIAAAELSREAGEPKILARCLRLLAAIEAEVRHDYAAARDLVAEVLELLAPLDDALANAAAYSYLGLVCNQEGEYQRGLEAWRNASLSLTDTSERTHQDLTLMYAADACLSLGDADEAFQILTTEVSEELGPAPRLSAMFNTLMARAQLQRGEPHVASHHINVAFTQSGEIADPALVCDQWRVLGQVASATGGVTSAPPEGAETITAGECFERALAELQLTRSRELHEALVYSEWARHEAQAGQKAAAREKAAQAKERFVSLNAPAHLRRHEDLWALVSLQ